MSFSPSVATPMATLVATPIATPVATSSRIPKVVWTREMERKLLDLLLEQFNLRRKAEGGFRKEAWTAIEKRFNEELKLNLQRENFKNKLKMWKSGYRIMKELRNTSGFSWNETTQCMDAEDSVWDELLKRKEFRTAKVYKRQPFYYFNELAAVVGNDIVEENIAATAQDTEDGNLFDETVDLDGDDDFNTHVNIGANLDEDFLLSNQCTASTRSNPIDKEAKEEEGKLSASLDATFESIHMIQEGIHTPHTIKVDKNDSKKDVANVIAALKAIPRLSRDTMNVACDSFMHELTRAIWFLEMDDIGANLDEDFLLSNQSIASIRSKPHRQGDQRGGRQAGRFFGCNI